VSKSEKTTQIILTIMLKVATIRHLKTIKTVSTYNIKLFI